MEAMTVTEFQSFKIKFQSVDLEEKIKMYVNVKGINQIQYKELLNLFPKDKIHLLESAL